MKGEDPLKCVHRFNLILRPTEVSRRLGFLRFHTIDASREFVERNYPYIFFYGPTNDRSTKVRIAYSREREDRPRASDWNCRKVSQRGGPRQPAFPDRRGTQLPTWAPGYCSALTKSVSRSQLFHTYTLFQVQ